MRHDWQGLPFKKSNLLIYLFWYTVSFFCVGFSLVMVLGLFIVVASFVENRLYGMQA